jgi:hypothetical protein
MPSDCAIADTPIIRAHVALNVSRGGQLKVQVVRTIGFAGCLGPEKHASAATAQLAALRRSKKVPQWGNLDDVLSRQDSTH